MGGASGGMSARVIERTDEARWALVNSIRPFIGVRSRSIAASYRLADEQELEWLGVNEAWKASALWSPDHVSGANFLTFAAWPVVQMMLRHAIRFSAPVHLKNRTKGTIQTVCLDAPDYEEEINRLFSHEENTGEQLDRET